MSKSNEAGFIAESRCRATGTTVTLYLADAAGIDAMGAKYALVCREHGEILATTTQADRYYMAHPYEFCPDCENIREARESS